MVYSFGLKPQDLNTGLRNSTLLESKLNRSRNQRLQCLVKPGNDGRNGSLQNTR